MNAGISVWHDGGDGPRSAPAGTGPCLVLAVGARQGSVGPDWGGYTVDETALRHGAGVEEETFDPAVAYGRFPPRTPAAYREGWLPK
jgi:hypothetical protein